MSQIALYQMEHPSEETFWRSIVLFGVNTASYKFALAESLLHFIKSAKSEVSLEELAVPFSDYICQHISKAPRQATNPSSNFLSACSDFNEGKIAKPQLIDLTCKNAFRYVLDAFHYVNGGELPIRFFDKDLKSGKKKIILTDEIYKLSDSNIFNNISKETEARWNLVETAWQLGISSKLLNVKYDLDNTSLFIDDSLRRIDITSARDALNGYQKGKCFYCYDNISIDSFSDDCCDVDHFFPHTLQGKVTNVDLNGVWNLVLACKDCNRGPNGKFAKLPHIKYLERLSKRNEFLINSHHPLRETLIKQTGSTEKERADFLRHMYEQAQILGVTWETEEKAEATF